MPSNCPVDVAVNQHHWYCYTLEGVDYYSDAVVTAVIGGFDHRVNMTVYPSGQPSFNVSNVPNGCFVPGNWVCHNIGLCDPSGCGGGLR